MLEFKFETVAEIPSTGGGGSAGPKYDWSAFPKPVEGKGFPKTTILGIKSAKTLYTSIKRYRAGLEGQGKKPADLPEFTVRASKDKDGKTVGFDVYRVK